MNNNPIALSAHKTNNKNKFGKLLTTNKYKIIKKKINLNKVVNQKVKNKSIEKEEIDKGPIDNEKINIISSFKFLTIKNKHNYRIFHGGALYLWELGSILNQ